MKSIQETFKFWADFEDILTILFKGPVFPEDGDSRHIVAGIENESLSVELNLYPYEEVEEGRWAFAEYYVCDCVDGEWGSLDSLIDIKGYQGIIHPTLTPKTTKEDLKREMSEILTQLIQVLEV